MQGTYGVLLTVSERVETEKVPVRYKDLYS